MSDAEEELGRYLQQRETDTGYRFVGVTTDGADFFSYELKDRKLHRLSSQFILRGELRKKGESAVDAGHALLAWLSPFLALRPELPPDPDTVRQELGRESVAYEIARSRIEALWTEVKDFPDVMLKRQLWSERLGLVYGTSIDDDALFFQHSYLVAKAFLAHREKVSNARI